MQWMDFEQQPLYFGLHSKHYGYRPNVCKRDFWLKLSYSVLSLVESTGCSTNKMCFPKCTPTPPTHISAARDILKVLIPMEVNNSHSSLRMPIFLNDPKHPYAHNLLSVTHAVQSASAFRFFCFFSFLNITFLLFLQEKCKRFHIYIYYIRFSIFV